MTCPSCGPAVAREHMRMVRHLEQAEELIADLRARLAHAQAERDDALTAASISRAMR